MAKKLSGTDHDALFGKVHPNTTKEVAEEVENITVDLQGKSYTILFRYYQIIVCVMDNLDRWGGKDKACNHLAGFLRNELRYTKKNLELADIINAEGVQRIFNQVNGRFRDAARPKDNATALRWMDRWDDGYIDLMREINNKYDLSKC